MCSLVLLVGGANNSELVVMYLISDDLVLLPENFGRKLWKKTGCSVKKNKIPAILFQLAFSLPQTF